MLQGKRKALGISAADSHIALPDFHALSGARSPDWGARIALTDGGW